MGLISSEGFLQPVLGAEGKRGPSGSSGPGEERATVPVVVSGEAASGLQGAPEVGKVRQGY